MRTVLSILLFFPSITFGLLSAEIFPWAFLVSIIYIRTLNKNIFFILVLLIISSLYSLYQFSFNLNQMDLIRSLATYANILFASQYILSLDKKQIFRLARIGKFIFFFLVFLGFAQLIGFQAIDSFIKLLIPRGSGFSLLESGRGVTLLSTEPARAGIELTLIYCIYRLTLLKNHTFHVFDVLLIIFQIAVIKSTSSVFFSFIFIGFMYLNLRGLLILPLIIAVGFYFLSFFEGNRASDLVLAIAELDDLSAITFFIVNESGNRLLGLYSFFKFGFYHPFGGGLGLWPETSMQAVVESGFDYTSIRFFDVVSDGRLSPFRGPGLISNLMLDIGIIGTSFVSLAFIKIIKPLKNFLRQEKFGYVAILIFLVKIFVFGSPGNPIPFLMLLIILKYQYFSNLALRKV
tara:strand:+ start:2902 stop:4113 length:1212 start_codon:yes stop_codon:yes gene_type:complete